MMESFDFRTLYLILQSPLSPQTMLQNCKVRWIKLNIGLGWGGGGGGDLQYSPVGKI